MSQDATSAHAPRPAQRPVMRDPSPREDSSRARAEARAAELRDHGSLDEDAVDEFYIDPSDIPDGWAYEWKRDTCLGAEDPSYQVQLARAGWEPVSAERHPAYMPKGTKGSITRKGMVLMERPAEIVAEAKARELRKARAQVRQKDEQLGATPVGTLPRDADERVRPRLNKTYEAIPVPD